MTGKSTVGRFAALLAAAFTATTAFAGRYWVGAADGDALYSNTANWSSSKDGAGGATPPGDGTSNTYFYKLYNGRTVFDAVGMAPSTVQIGTRSADYFVWSATDPSYGLSSANNQLYVGYKISGACSPANLQIDSGTYNYTYARIGYESGGIANLLLNGGNVTCSKAYVGATGHADGTLTVKGGTFKTTSTSSSDSLGVGCVTNAIGTVVVDGGRLENVGYASLGYVSNVTALINVKSGTWIASGVHLGSTANKATNYIDHAVSRIVVDGGTVMWTNVNHSCMGNAIGEGSYAEMIVNNGDVNCAATYFYIGDTGPATFTMNGGTFTMTHPSGIINLGHQKTGRDIGTLVLNGGALAVRKLRLDYSQPGSKIVFNGGTLKPITGASDFIDAAGNAANVTCEVQAGGMVIDTAGYNVTIKHDLVLADGVTSAPLIKKGAGTLTLSGSTPFEEENIFVYEGTANVGGVAYGVNIGDITDASAGGDLGEVVLHGEKLEGWLKDPDYIGNYISNYGAAGTASLENPLTITMSVNGALKRYSNLETGKTYNDTVNGVSYSFTTEDLPPRTLQVVAPNGTLIKNVRDVGSWPLVSANGVKKMNQGVIFRGARLDDFANATAAQKAASALADLKTEIDLRPTSEIASGYQNISKSWAAVDADYWQCPIVSGTQLSSDDNGVFTNQVRRMFSKLGTQGALPAYFHCAIGTDRTGITGLLLLGLMGVEEEVLYRDYLMSNFANIGSSRTPGVPEKFILYLLRGDCNGNKYVYRDNAYGATVAGRARAYLEMCGVTTAEIANITQALSGETPAEVLARVDAYEAANNFRTVTYIPYSGATTTNAMHRLPAGTHILPVSAPARTGYVFAGWDTEHETNGVVYANWTPLVPHYWSSTNGVTESFARADAWDPALDGGVFEPDDVLVLNKGNDKVALLSEGSISVQSLYVGWGSLDGGRTSSTANDHGGRLDMTGGTLNVTNILYIGGYRSAYSNIVNVSGGSLVAHTLYMGDYYDSKKNGKCDVLNISGNGAVENTTGEFQMSIRSGGASTRLNITDNGSFTCLQNVKLSTAAAGKSAIAIDGNGSMTIASGKSIYIGHGGGGLGEISLDGSATFSGVYDVVMGYVAGSTGRVHVAGNSSLSASHYIYVGRLGSGEMTIDGGHVTGMSTTYFGFTGASGNSAVLNLNGGKLTTRSLTVAGSPNAVFNWNGGTLECSTYSYAEGNMIPANANLQVNVLAGGAVYNAVARDDEEIKHELSGVGSLTKKGNKPLTVSGAVNLAGGFIVEAGTLTLSNVTGTEFRRISVADGASLDLNGAEVTVGEYKLNGVRQPNGTYEAHNGTIHVKMPPFVMFIR